MPVSAHDIAAALRERQPDLGVKKLHKLLYYCQGHHLATFGRPLFIETISAWDMGPIVPSLWKREQEGDLPEHPAELGEAELNTVGYVLSRWGGYSGGDLERLTHGEPPWLAGDAVRKTMGSRAAKIETAWIEQHFRNAAAEEGEDEPQVDPEALKNWLAGAEARRARPARPDNRKQLLARLAEG